MTGSKITDLDIPFYFSRKEGQGSIMIRIEGDSRELCEEILESIEILGDQSRLSLLRIDKYPREITVFIMVDTKTES